MMKLTSTETDLYIDTDGAVTFDISTTLAGEMLYEDTKGLEEIIADCCWEHTDEDDASITPDDAAALVGLAAILRRSADFIDAHICARTV